MKVDMIEFQGMVMRVILVNNSDPSRPCENCGKPCYDHELLIKDDKDWCMPCNDKEFRNSWTDVEVGMWAQKSMEDGYAIAVVHTEPWGE